MYARGKLSLPVITGIFCALAFIVLLYTERITTSSGSLFGIKTCPRRNAAKFKKQHTGDGELKSSPLDNPTDDRFVFDPEECSLNNGKWVFNTSIKPFYTHTTCPYIDRQYSCTKNGRNDSDYLHWEWRPDDCILPRFDPNIALRKIQGKRTMFVGDSIQRNMWESFVCLVQSVIPEGQKSMKQRRVHSVFKAKEYNATIEFYWAPFLVESNTDIHIKADPKQRIIKVDSIAERAKQWLGVDILVFNTYVWWMSGLKAKALWGEFANGEEGYEEFDTVVSYKLALRTWANWIDSTIDTNKTKVFFTTMSPTHQRYASEVFSSPEMTHITWKEPKTLSEFYPTLYSKGTRYSYDLFELKTHCSIFPNFRNEDWGNMNGIKCFNETRPVMTKGHWGVGSNTNMMKAVVDVIGRMKVPVTVLNITQLSEHRIDGHASVYGELGGKLLTDKQKADPLHFADCIHWCLPGVPDTWNRMLYAYL